MSSSFATESGYMAGELRAAMARTRTTGAQLAKLLGVSAAWVSDRANGKTTIQLEELYAIAAVLKIPVTALLPTNINEIPSPRTIEPRIKATTRTTGARIVTRVASVATEDFGGIPGRAIVRPASGRPHVRTDTRRPPTGSHRPPGGPGRTSRVRPGDTT